MINDILDKHDKDVRFKKKNYFQEYIRIFQALINSEKLANILNRNEFKDNFYSINFDLDLCKMFISILNDVKYNFLQI